MAMATASIQEDIVNPELARTSSYSKAMTNGSANAHKTFKSQLMTSPEILGVTKTFDVKLSKQHGESLGFEVHSDELGKHFVANVDPNGMVKNLFLEHDEIELVNNVSASTLSHDQLVENVVNATTLEIVIRRTNEFYKDVVLERPESGNYGIHLGSSPMDNTSLLDHLFVSAVNPDGVASNQLFSGDIVVAINAKLIGNMKYPDAIACMKDDEKVRFTVLRSEITKESISKTLDGRPAVLIVTVSISRQSLDHKFGVTLGAMDNRDNQVVTGSKIDSLLIGDEVVAVNGESCEGKTHEEVVELLNKSLDVEIEVHRHVAFNADGNHEVVPVDSNFPKAIDRQTPTHTFDLRRDNVDVSWGMSFVTSTHHQIHRVTTCEENSPTGNVLQEFDELCTIDGVDCMGLSHDSIVEKVKDLTEMSLAIFRHGDEQAFGKSLDARAPDSHHISRGFRRSVVAKEATSVVAKVRIERKSDEKYGFGIGTEANGDSYIDFVVDSSPGYNILQQGDKLIAIDGESLSGLRHKDIVDVLSSSLVVHLTVERPLANDSNAVVHNFIKRAYQDSITLERQTVMLSKTSPSGGFGFGIGTLASGGKIVTHTSQNVTAIRPSDVIFSVNGKSIHGLDHQDVVTAILAENDVTLEIGRELDNVDSEDDKNGKRKLRKQGSISVLRPGLRLQDRAEDDLGAVQDVRVKVKVERSSTNEGFGFNLGTDVVGDSYIGDVTTGGPAAGKLKANDKLIEVDGQSISGWTHQYLVETLSSKLVLTLTLERQLEEETNASLHEFIQRANIGEIELDTMEVTLTRLSPSQGFGFGVGTLSSGSKIVTHTSEGVTEIRPADVIFKVNGASVEGLDHQGLVQAIIAQETVTLEIGREPESNKPSSDGTENSNTATTDVTNDDATEKDNNDATEKDNNDATEKDNNDATEKDNNDATETVDDDLANLPPPPEDTNDDDNDAELPPPPEDDSVPDTENTKTDESNGEKSEDKSADNLGSESGF